MSHIPYPGQTASFCSISPSFGLHVERQSIAFAVFCCKSIYEMLQQCRWLFLWESLKREEEKERARRKKSEVEVLLMFSSPMLPIVCCRSDFLIF